MLYKNKNKKGYVLIKEKLDDICDTLNAIPGKSLHFCLFKIEISRSTDHTGTKLLYSLLPQNCKVRIQYCRWFQESVSLIQGLFLYQSSMVLIMWICEHSQNWHSCKENSHVIPEVPLHNVKIELWHPFSTQWLIILWMNSLKFLVKIWLIKDCGLCVHLILTSAPFFFCGVH